MIPDGVLATVDHSAPFLPPRDAYPQALVDFELGGVGISDASQGLMKKGWRCQWVDGDFVLDAAGVSPTVVYSRDNVQELSFTFDQNMKPFLTWVDDAGAFYRWYDATVPGYQVIALPSGVVSPKCSLDDKRFLQGSISDILLTYVRAGSLYYLQQRDRFDTEYLLKADVSGYIRRFGMNTQLSMQWEMGN